MSRDEGYGLNLGFGCLLDIEVKLSTHKLDIDVCAQSDLII